MNLSSILHLTIHFPLLFLPYLSPSTSSRFSEISRSISQIPALRVQRNLFFSLPSCLVPSSLSSFLQNSSIKIIPTRRHITSTRSSRSYRFKSSLKKSKNRKICQLYQVVISENAENSTPRLSLIITVSVSPLSHLRQDRAFSFQLSSVQAFLNGAPLALPASLENQKQLRSYLGEDELFQIRFQAGLSSFEKRTIVIRRVGTGARWPKGSEVGGVVGTCMRGREEIRMVVEFLVLAQNGRVSERRNRSGNERIGEFLAQEEGEYWIKVPLEERRIRGERYRGRFFFKMVRVMRNMRCLWCFLATICLIGFGYFLVGESEDLVENLRGSSNYKPWGFVWQP